MIKTYHGSFETAIDKYLIDGQSSAYLHQIGEFAGEGSLLKDFSLEYLSRLSYRETNKLITEVTTSNLNPTRFKKLLSERNAQIKFRVIIIN